MKERKAEKRKEKGRKQGRQVRTRSRAAALPEHSLQCRFGDGAVQ